MLVVFGHRPGTAIKCICFFHVLLPCVVKFFPFWCEFDGDLADVLLRKLYDWPFTDSRMFITPEHHGL